MDTTARWFVAYVRLRRCILLLGVIYVLAACGGSDAERVRELSEDTPVGDSPVTADIGVLEVEEGDCIVSGLDAGTTVEAVTIVPCSDVWQYRVSAIFDTAEADQYPGEDALGEEAAGKCGSDVGHYLYPTTESWDLGDREIVCLEKPPAPTTTSLPSAPTTTEAVAASTPAQSGSALPLSASEVYELVAPSIVFVETETATGSGILVEGGYVVTNYHVVWPHDAVWVVFPDGTEVWVPVVGWDPFADLAVLGPVSVSAQPLILADGEAMPPGSSVFLVGYPAETDVFPQVSITEGIVSRFREWELAGLTLFQTDAAIAGGQSGGALVNTDGEVIGISTWGFSEAGFSVATSAADAAPIVEWLIQEGAVLAWSEILRSPGAGEFEFEVELVNRWDNRAFMFVAEVGSLVEVSIEGEADGVLRVSSPLGVHVLADDSYSGVESGTVEVLTEGVHFLEVWTLLDELGFDGPHTYTVSSSSRLQVFEDPDDGQHLSVGDVVGGVIDYFSDIDWYTIDLDEGDTIVVWTDAIATDTALFVDSYSGAMIDDIAHDDDSGPTLFGDSFNAELVYTAPASGRFIVAVQGLTGSSGGSYFLGIDTEARTGSEPVSSISAPEDTDAESLGSAFGSVSSGDSFSCGLRTDGTVTCWGSNGFGQLDVPTDGFKAVSAGEIHACGLRTDGTVTCWGGDVYGSGNGPLDVPDGSFTAISSGSGFSCGIRSDGSVTCWGYGDVGETDPPTGSFAAVSAGQWHACGIRENRTVTCWGSNEYAQLEAPGGEFTAVSAGVLHSCGIRDDGTTICWGENGFGQSDAPREALAAVSVYHRHSCGIRTDGTVTCWGLFWYGEADPPSGAFTAVSAGSEHSCGLKPEGTITCWGSNDDGQSDSPGV